MKLLAPRVMVPGRTGVPVKVGEALNTKFPVPVVPVTADARLAAVGVPRKVATPVPSPEIPVETGRPVALVRVAADGGPRVEVATQVVPVPVVRRIIPLVPTALLESRSAPVAKISPTTESSELVVVVPMPISPAEVIRRRSEGESPGDEP